MLFPGWRPAVHRLWNDGVGAERRSWMGQAMTVVGARVEDVADARQATLVGVSTEEYADVALGASRDAGGVDVELLGQFLPTVAAAARTGRRLRRAELTRCAEHGRDAALAGVALRALIDLYLSACWRLWETLETGDDAADVRASALAVLRAADDAVAALAEGFQLARNDLARRQEQLRTEVIEAVLAGGQEAVAVTGRAAELGVDLTAPHAVLVVRHDRSFDDPATLAVPRRLERALQGRHGDANPLVAVKHGRLVCVFAAPDPASIRWVGERLGEVLGGPPGWQAATGAALPGAGSVRVSYQQAQDALALAAEIGLATPVVNSADLALYRVLLRDRAAIEELIASRLGPLAGVRGGPAVALETLDAYYGCGGVATAAAARLHLSVRALTYRLQRVAELLGVDATDPAERLALHAAVLGARLLGWPELPDPGSQPG